MVNVNSEVIDQLVQSVNGLRTADYSHAIIPTSFLYQDGNPVAVIAGGTGGLQDALYVGKGLLTASILGSDVQSLISGIREVTADDGCLLLVKDRKMDITNFCKAAKLATHEGYKIQMVTIGRPSAEIDGPRPASVLLYKVAGAAAAGGLNLETVTFEADNAFDLLRGTDVNEDEKPFAEAASSILEKVFTKRNSVVHGIILKRLEAPTDAPGWPAFIGGASPSYKKAVQAYKKQLKMNSGYSNEYHEMILSRLPYHCSYEQCNTYYETHGAIRDHGTNSHKSALHCPRCGDSFASNVDRVGHYCRFW